MRLFISSLSSEKDPVIPLPIVDANDAVSVNAVNHLDLPTSYVPNNQNTHPGVEIAPNGISWNGYKYWMAITPYPFSAGAYENPEILCSNDGEAWIVPNGLTNPIWPEPFRSHNSDTDLLFYNDILYCYFNGVDLIDGDTQGHYVMWSSDGVNWSGPNVVVNAEVVEEDNFWAGFSPCVLERNGVFTLWHIKVDPAGGNSRVMRIFTSTDPIGVFTYTGEGIINNMPSGWYNWHLDINKYGDKYHAFFNLGVSSGGTSTILYFAISDDGITWNVADNYLLTSPVNGWDNGKIYRASGIYNADSHSYKLWYSAFNDLGEWFTGLTDVTFDNE